MSAISIKRKNGDIIHLTEVVRYGKDFINTVTNNPVENGSKISDHVQGENARFSINGYIAWSDITNQTGVQSGGNVNSQAGGVSVMGQDLPTVLGGASVYKALKAIRDNKELVDIVESALRVSSLYSESSTEGFTLHKNCILTSLSFDEDSETGDGTNVSLMFEQIRLVTLREVEVKVVKQTAGKGTSGTNKGNTSSSGVPATNTASQAAKKQDKGELQGFREDWKNVTNAVGEVFKVIKKKQSDYLQ